MGILTDKDMQSKPKAVDQWLTEDGPRGAGRLVARITRGGDRGFYFRYTTSSGSRDTLPIGSYHPKGQAGLTLAQARDKAGELSRLYQSGVKDLRAHFEQAEADRLAAEALQREKIAEERRVLEAAAEAASLAQARRKTVKQLFEQWRATLKPMLRADGRRVGRKDGGQYVFEQFSCIDPVNSCSGVNVEGNDDEHPDGRRHQALDSQA